MFRPNVIPIVGNHEYMAVKVLEYLCVEITEENVETQITADTMRYYTDWMFNGGDSTIEEFNQLSLSEKLRPSGLSERFFLIRKWFL